MTPKQRRQIEALCQAALSLASEQRAAFLAAHPMHLIEWRNHLALARVLTARNRPAAAREAYTRADVLLRGLAGTITDPVHRETFRSMSAVREVQAGARGDG